MRVTVVWRRCWRVLQVPCRGRGESPDPLAVNMAVWEIRKSLAAQPNLYILVHCTHGFNRSGARQDSMHPSTDTVFTVYRPEQAVRAGPGLRQAPDVRVLPRRLCNHQRCHAAAGRQGLLCGAAAQALQGPGVMPSSVV